MMDKELIKFVNDSNSQGIHVTKVMMYHKAGFLANKYGVVKKFYENRQHVKRVVKILLRHQMVGPHGKVPVAVPASTGLASPSNEETSNTGLTKESTGEIQFLCRVKKPKSETRFDYRTLLINKLREYSKELLTRLTHFMNRQLSMAAISPPERVRYMTQVRESLVGQLFERSNSVLSTLGSAVDMSVDLLCDAAKILMHQLLNLAESTIRYFAQLCRFEFNYTYPRSSLAIPE